MFANIHSVGNAIEAGLRWSLAMAILVAGWRKSQHRIHGTMAAAALLAFGLSDVVEIQTGAWLRPWWLLAWKAACIVALVYVWWHYRRRNREHATG